MSIELSLILPCYNEGRTLPDSLAQILACLDSMRCSYEVILVDDASRDGTIERVRELAARHRGKGVKALFHEANRGRGAAVATGFAAATGEILGYIDVDLEVGPEYILPCWLAVRRGGDVAIGRRIYKLRWHSVYREALSKGYRWIAGLLLGLPGYDTECGYKFFRREALMTLLRSARSPGWFWDTEVMFHACRSGLNVIEVPCLFLRRFDKRSTVRPLRDACRYLRELAALATRRAS